MSLAVEFQARVTGLDRVMAMLARLEAPEMREGLEGVGAVVESQFRRRLASEKTTPDGERWKPWSRAYARTRHGNQSLLVATGHLMDSMAFEATDSEVAVGSNMIYAAVQNATRPFIGLGNDNRREVREVIGDFVEGLVAG